MRRIVPLLTVLGVLGVSLGCHHIGGKCDCQANPNDAVQGPPSAPYPATPIAGSGVVKPATPVVVPEKMPVVPVTPIPR